MENRRFHTDARGSSAIEYALIIALIAVAGIMAFQQTGQGVEDTMTEVGDALPAPATGGVPPTP